MNEVALLTLVHANERPSAGDWANVLAGFPLFAGIGKRRLRKLTRDATFAEFAAGEMMVLAGDRGTSLYVILGGEVRARSRHAVRALRTGDHFDGLETVVATSLVHVMRLRSRAVLRLVDRRSTRSGEDDRHAPARNALPVA